MKKKERRKTRTLLYLFYRSNRKFPITVANSELTTNINGNGRKSFLMKSYDEKSLNIASPCSWLKLGLFIAKTPPFFFHFVSSQLSKKCLGKKCISNPQFYRKIASGFNTFEAFPAAKRVHEGIEAIFLPYQKGVSGNFFVCYQLSCFLFTAGGQKLGIVGIFARQIFLKHCSNCAMKKWILPFPFISRALITRRKKKKKLAVATIDYRCADEENFVQWFENVKCCREAALHLLVKQIPPPDSWHQAHSDRCNFHPLMPALTLVSLLKRYLWFEPATARGDIGKRPCAHL